MKCVITLFILFFYCSINLYGQKKESSTNALIFSKTAGFRHASIPKGAKVLDSLLKSIDVKSTHTEDNVYFSVDSLRKFDVVIFLSTTGDILSAEHKINFQKFIRSGKGFVGVHAASDTEYNWSWYGQLVGGYFSSHPKVQDASIKTLDSNHLSTKHLPKIWFHRDEWYDFKDIKPGLHILMNLDEESYEGGKMGKFHPIAWYQEFDGGRSFYTGLGHTIESYDSEKFQKHLIGGIRYAIGDKK